MTTASSGGGAAADGARPVKVLAVCLGNICRSPTFEAVLRAKAEAAGAAVVVDSCGTGGGSRSWFQAGGFSYHEGDAADARMTAAAARRGVRLTSRSRPLTLADLAEQDYIVGMDAANLAAIRAAAAHWGADAAAPGWAAKLSLATDYLAPGGAHAGKYDCVPDPYYGGEAGFELVLDLLDDAAGGLLAAVAAARPR